MWVVRSCRRPDTGRRAAPRPPPAPGDSPPPTRCAGRRAHNDQVPRCDVDRVARLGGRAEPVDGAARAGGAQAEGEARGGHPVDADPGALPQRAPARRCGGRGVAALRRERAQDERRDRAAVVERMRIRSDGCRELRTRERRRQPRENGHRRSHRTLGIGGAPQQPRPTHTVEPLFAPADVGQESAGQCERSFAIGRAAGPLPRPVTWRLAADARQHGDETADPRARRQCGIQRGEVDAAAGARDRPPDQPRNSESLLRAQIGEHDVTLRPQAALLQPGPQRGPDPPQRGIVDPAHIRRRPPAAGARPRGGGIGRCRARSDRATPHRSPARGRCRGRPTGVHW